MAIYKIIFLYRKICNTKKIISSFYTLRRERHNFCTFYTKNYTHSTESYIIVIIVNFIDLGIYFLSSEERREKSKLKVNQDIIIVSHVTPVFQRIKLFDKL